MSEWVATLLGGVPKSEILDPSPLSPLAGLGRRIVDVACSCGERLGAVTDEPDGLALTLWAPPLVLRSTPAGEPLWSVRTGPLPDVDVSAHCFRHGETPVSARQLAASINRYRTNGRRTRLVAN